MAPAPALLQWKQHCQQFNSQNHHWSDATLIHKTRSWSYAFGQNSRHDHLLAESQCKIAIGIGDDSQEKEKATPVGDHNGSLCIETAAAWDYDSQDDFQQQARSKRLQLNSPAVDVAMSRWNSIIESKLWVLQVDYVSECQYGACLCCIVGERLSCQITYRCQVCNCAPRTRWSRVTLSANPCYLSCVDSIKRSVEYATCSG